MDKYKVKYRKIGSWFSRTVEVTGHSTTTQPGNLVLYTAKGFVAIAMADLEWSIPEWNNVAQKMAEAEAGQKLQVNT